MEQKLKGCIWIINQYASHLEQRHLQLAKHFSNCGYETVVITSSFHHGNKTYLSDKKIHMKKIQKGVIYIYLHSGPSYKRNGLGRIINMFDFSLIVQMNAAKIASLTRVPNYIIASSAPPFVWENGYSIAKKYSAKFIAEFRDIWPLSFIDIQGMSRLNPWIRLLERIERRAYRRANAIVSTMPLAYKHVCAELGYPRDKVHWLPNGMNMEEADKAREDKDELPKNLDAYLSDNWCCIYTGSFVKSEALPFIISGIKALKHVNLAIIGDGEEREDLEKILTGEKIENIKIFPRITKRQVAIALQKAKCCVAASHNYPIYRFGYSTNKIPDYLYSGTPTVFACVQEGYYEDSGVITVPADNVEAFRKAIIKVKEMTSKEIKDRATRSIQAVKANYDYRTIGNRYLDVLESL